MLNQTLARLINPAINANLGGANVNGIQASGSIIRGLINAAFVAGSLIFVAMLIWGGIQYITSGGEKEVVQKSSKRISSALFGLLILFSVYVILSLISSFTGLNLVNFAIPTFTNS